VKKIIVIVMLAFVMLSCTDFVTVKGEVIDKQYVPEGGFGGPSEDWRVILRTDNGIKILSDILVYYDLQIGEKIEYTYDRNCNSFKSSYRKIGY
jgi:hypothetical protein